MFALSDLRVPVVAAPMAGGPSTPALVTAVADAGGLGFLAAGYKTPQVLQRQIAEVRARADVFGVNVFVPGESAADSAAVESYRRRLREQAAGYGTELPQPDPADRDAFEDKLDLLQRDPVPVVSFTFGAPPVEAVRRLHAVGTSVVATVTTPAEARTAEERGSDALAVQGCEAGGHRGTFTVDAPDDGVGLLDVLARVRAGTSLPLIAAGGLGTGADIARALAAGADAVQLGTAYLRCPESGASQPHKDALADPHRETLVTRAFSGRLARGLRNRFLDEHHEAAPAAYPEVNQLTKPLRAAAAARGDVEGLALWAGTKHGDATTESAATVTRRLWREAST